MAFLVNDRVKETSTTTGTGTLSLAGAVSGFQTFVAGIGNSNVTYYAIVNDSGTEFEIGIGTVTDASPDTLSRTTILESSNSDSAVDFSAGTKTVFCTLPASKAVFEDNNNDVTLPDDLILGSDSAVLKFGNDSDITITHAADTGLTTNGTFQATTITATTAFVPDASDGAALGTSSLEFSDLFLADGAVINFGDDQDINITHVADTGLTTNADFTVGDDLFISGGLIDLKNTGTASQIKFYCESSNAHAQTLIAAPHSEGATNTLTLPGTGGDARLVSTASTATLTNKTLTSPKINEDVAVTSTATEINLLDGVTATTAELNILDGVTSTAAELNALDGITAVVGELNALDLGSTAVGTAIASKAVILDSNKDYTGIRNLTITGELDAATLDISGDVDVDGTLEADAITVNGATLAETVTDLVGGMVSSNTETGITVTFQDADNTLDFALGAAQTTITSLLATDIKIGEDDQTKIDFETADEIHFYANNTEQVYLADNIFGPQSDSDVDLGTTGVRWKDAFVDSITVTGNGDIDGNLDVDGTTNLDAVDIDGTLTVGEDDTGHDVKFFGATASAYMLWDESEDDLILGGAARIVVPEGQLVLGSTAVSSTAAELNLLDGVSGLVQADLTKLAAVNSTDAELNLLDGSAKSTSSITVADADALIVIDGTTTKQIPASDMKTYIGGGTSWQAVKTANFTAAAGQGVFCNTTSSAFTITLPAGTIGDEVSIIDYAGTFDSNNLTVAANGSEKIHGSTDDLTVATERAAFTLVFTDSTQGWLLKDK